MRYRLECPANRYVFKSRLNCSESTAGSLRQSGSEFQTVGPATEKARVPKVFFSDSSIYRYRHCVMYQLLLTLYDTAKKSTLRVQTLLSLVYDIKMKISRWMVSKSQTSNLLITFAAPLPFHYHIKETSLLSDDKRSTYCSSAGSGGRRRSPDDTCC